MPTEIRQPFYDKLRKHFETGVPWQDMSFSEEQKRRIEVCLDAYKRFSTDPFIDLPQYLRNRWKRTFNEIKNDMRVVEFIAAFYEEGQRNITKMQVRHASRMLMKNGADTGNMKALAEGASLAFKLERLDQPDTPEDIDANMARMPIIVTTDVGKKFKGKQGHDSEEMKKIRKKYGVKQDYWQEMVEVRTGEYIPAGSEESGEYAEEEEPEETGEDEDCRED